MLRELRPERLANVRDGTSNTLAITESHTTGDNRHRAFWGYGRNQYSLASATPTAAIRLVDHNQCVRAMNGDVAVACRHRVASFHPGGANGVFADGSVRFLQENLNPRILMALATIAGEEVVPNF
jgi:prepilin-type processing-associated H-X9-DG protein